MIEITSARVRQWLPHRPEDGHKGSFGRALIAAGSVGFTGAPTLSANACVRSGAGLVFLAVPQSVWTVAAAKCNEAMPSPCPEDEMGRFSAKALPGLLERAKGCDALLLGPGLGQSEELDSLVMDFLRLTSQSMVLDADGLNALSRHIDSLSRDNLILTPHDGEYARLMGHWPGADREAAARELSGRLNCVAVLKGHRTIVAAPDGTCYVNTTGNHGMAKGGSGDVLAGLMTGLLAQGMSPVQAAASAVWIHGRAGDIAAGRFSYHGMTPTDLVGCLTQVWKELE